VCQALCGDAREPEMTAPSLAIRIKECAQLSGEFTLRSGKVSSTYFDKYLFESDPVLLHAICVEMGKLIPAGTDILAGLEMGGIPVVTVLSQITGIPCAFLRKEAKEYGTCKYAEGPDLKCKNVVLIEDVVSSGGAIIDQLDQLAEDGIKPTAIVCVIDRQTGGYENLSSAGYRLDSVLKMEDIVDAT